jgi:hypothetical protein
MPSLFKPSLLKPSLFKPSLSKSAVVKPGLIKIVFGVAAVSLTLGAVQFASGHDLPAPTSSAKPGETVNRAGKEDRAAVAAPAAKVTRTIAFRPGDLPDTSVLVRIPLTKQARDTARTPLPIRSGQSKPMVACEPVVSVLTEVARKLEPGRCVT